MSEIILKHKDKDLIKKTCDYLLSTIDISDVRLFGIEMAKKLNIRIIGYSSLTLNKQLISLKISKEGFAIINGKEEYIFYNDIGIDIYEQNVVIIKNIGHIILDHTGCKNNEEEEAIFFLDYIINCLKSKSKINKSIDYLLYKTNNAVKNDCKINN